MGLRTARHPGDRPLVADRDRLADRGQPGRHRAAADQGRLADACRCPAGTCRSSTRRGDARRGRHRRRHRRQAADAAGRACPRCGTTTSASSAPTCRAFDGYYLTGDGGHLDDDGYVFVMGRTDDVINVAGHRLSTGRDGGGAGRAPRRRRVRRDRRRRPVEGPGAARVRGAQGRRRARSRRSCAAELVQLVRDQIGAVAPLKDVAVVPALPKTRSGQDPAQDHARHRRRRRRAGALDHRGRRACWTRCARCCGGGRPSPAPGRCSKATFPPDPGGKVALLPIRRRGPRWRP